MPASTKVVPLAENAADPRRLTLVVLAGVGGALLLLAAALVNPAAMQIFAIPATHRATNSSLSAVQAPVRPASPWAGGLEAPEAESVIIGPVGAPLTSAAYTTGFDRRAAGLGPLPAQAPSLKLTQPRDPRACPNDLNCSFRPLRAAATPPQRPIVAIPVDPSKTTPPPPPPSGMAVLAARLHLPGYLTSPTTLLKPFNFVSKIGNTVAGFVKKL